MWLAAALLWGACLTVADIFQRQGHRKALEDAATLTPLDARIPLLLAEVEPERAEHHLKQVRQLTPEYAAARVRLALKSEARGDESAAEVALLDAALRDTTFLPQWTLANFYFRRSRWEEFWRFAQQATNVYQGDLTGVFQLCMRVEPDPEALLKKMGFLHAPARLYLVRVLLTGKNYAGIGQIAGAVAKDGIADSLDVLLESCHQAATAGDAGAAVRVWNALVENGRFPGEGLAPAGGRSLNNGHFERHPSGACFDWKPAREDGVWMHAGSPSGLRVELTGRQSETLTILEQWLPVLPGARYELAWEARQDLRGGSAAIDWWEDGKRLAPLAQRNAVVAANGRSLIRLSLRTARAEGTARPEGRVEISRVRLKML